MVHSTGMRVMALRFKVGSGVWGFCLGQRFAVNGIRENLAIQAIVGGFLSKFETDVGTSERFWCD